MGQPEFSRAASSTNSTNSTRPLEEAVYPPQSLIADYLRFAQGMEESADSYLVGSILPVIAACLERRVYFAWGAEKIYPNIFSMLAGRAGERKSSAINLAEKYATAVLRTSMLLPQSLSAESLMDEYESDPDKLLLVDEANTVIGTWTGTGYGSRVGQQLLRLYDCKGLHEAFQKNKSETNVMGSRSVPETSTSVVLGATFDVCNLRGKGITSGLQRRFLFYVAEKHGRFIGHAPEPDETYFLAVAEGFEKLCQMEAVCRFSDKAAGVWGKYQRQNRVLIHEENREDILSRLNGAPRQVQKIAMLFEAACWALADNKWTGEIRAATLELAIQHVDHCLLAASKLDTLAKKESVAAEADSLLQRIRQDNRTRKDRIVLTKTQLTTKYAPHTGRAKALTPAYLYEVLIANLIKRNLATISKKEGKKVWYSFVNDEE